ncbi:hypothetical protein [Algimonas ampicilliniresistens]|nr:hypothetical protein [Algimonas ampicilliniresistens]
MAYSFDTKTLLETSTPLGRLPSSPRLLSRRIKRRARRNVRNF